ncbi:hypothetical protein CEUSTIGMA_g12681.t1, partial [Chlamydomonas eustigma]
TTPIFFPGYNGPLIETYWAPNDRYGLNLDGGVTRLFASELNGASALALSLNSNNTFTDLLYATHGGNVGIGTTNPQYTLDVNGTCYVNNLLNVGTVVQIDPSGSSVFNNRFVINNALQVGGGSILSGGANVTNGSLTVPNGNVGIGTTTPQYNLDVVGNAHVSSGFVVDGLITANDNLYFASTSIEHGIYFAGTPGDYGNSSIPYSGVLNRLYDPTGGSNVQTDYSELLLFQFNDFGPPEGPDRIRHLAGAHKFQVYTGASVSPTDTAAFWADNNYNTAMYIANSGYVGIGTNTPAYPLDVNGAGNVNGSFNVNGILQVNGTIFATGDIVALSDASVKTEIDRIQDPLKKMMELTGYTYQRGDSDRRHCGIIAQDLLRVLLEAVYEDGSGRLAVAYPNLVALLIEGVNELNQKMVKLAEKCQYYEATLHSIQAH